MPWKLIFYLVIVGLILVFVGLNLGHTTDISLGFVTYEEIPVFMGLFVAFFLGVAVSIPIAVQSSSRKTKARSERKRERAERKQERAERKQLRKTERTERGGLARLLPGNKNAGRSSEYGDGQGE
ncbi:MAG: hypothetical protein ACOC2V_02060 [Alkalispirochaeta sp.]